ncbi:hypothetical protein BSU04_25045 [Caballeronia sordidicola]|uniref:Uncharacterized protein n=1 Tax=Caballeronia sordidicola TaxID=196367 RepID=A0A226WY40_CABSO|nr:hypothetical protein BSU04_25045 [Caballeronia sordidicola]
MVPDVGWFGKDESVCPTVLSGNIGGPDLSAHETRADKRDVQAQPANGRPGCR